MSEKRKNPNKKRKKKKSFRPVITAILLAVVVMGAVLWFIRYAPTAERMELSDFYRYSTPDEAALISDGQYLEPADDEAPYAIVRDGAAYISVRKLKELYDDGYVWDPTENILRYATATSIVNIDLNADPYNYTDGGEPRSLSVPAAVTEDGADGMLYIAVDLVCQYTDITVASVNQDPGRIVIETPGYAKQVAQVSRNAVMRRFGGPKSKIVGDVKKQDSVSVVEDYGKWCQILTEDGILGCVKSSQLGPKQEQVTEERLPERTYEHMSMGVPVVLTWHQVTNQTANEYLGSVLAPVQGVNVISPTWFYLNDNQGGIGDLTDPGYVEKAHANGLLVWALVSNFENREVDTTTVLNTTSARDRVVDSLINSTLAAGADGINVDFEELSINVRDGYVQFIKELSIRCEQNGLYLSVDNYPPSEYTDFYNRSMQADYADYVVLMGYDEYNGSSTTAGPTASLPYVIQSLEDTLTEVPSNQLILGMPFYTRLWKTENGQLSTQAMGMNAVEALLSTTGSEKSWLETEQLNYTEYMEGDALCQIWIEDGESLSKKMALVSTYELAGGAFWKLGLETPEIWETIHMYFP